MKIELLPNLYLNENGTFNKDKAFLLCGKIAGVCYSKDGLSSLLKEDEDITKRRIKRTLDTGHHSVYDHISISFNFKNMPKILAMILNNEKQYTTSEKSARYTKVNNDSNLISEKEIELYNKWMDIFKIIIKEKYGYFYNDNAINKLAQENSRYLISVFMPTEMIYTTSLRQINIIASMLINYKDNLIKNDFNDKLFYYINEFISNLDNLNVLDNSLMLNEKERKLSLFSDDVDVDEYFREIYQVKYKSSFAELAQAQRHRTIHYEMSMDEMKTYFIPPILDNNKDLVDEWIKDLNEVKDITPQGELINIVEQGSYKNFY